MLLIASKLDRRRDPHAGIYPTGTYSRVISRGRIRPRCGGERKTRIESRSERASASGCNSANTFRVSARAGSARPARRIHPCEISSTAPARHVRSTSAPFCGPRSRKVTGRACAALPFRRTGKKGTGDNFISRDTAKDRAAPPWPRNRVIRVLQHGFVNCPSFPRQSPAYCRVSRGTKLCARRADLIVFAIANSRGNDYGKFDRINRIESRRIYS